MEKNASATINIQMDTVNYFNLYKIVKVYMQNVQNYYLF